MRFLNSISLTIYSFFKVRDSLVLILMGVALLSLGMDSISRAQITTEGWPNEGKGTAEQATPSPAEQANGRLAPATRFSGIAQQSFNTFVAQGAVARLAEGAEGRLAEAANGNGIAEAANGGIGIAEATEGRLAEEKDIPYDDTLIRNSVGNLYRFIEGAFGALIVVGAGIGAVIAGVVGAYKAAFALFVTAVGAFILRAYVSLFFGTDYVSYDAVGGDQALGFN